jgi:hypothetical protein
MNGRRWFVAKDVCTALELKNPTSMLQLLPADTRAKLSNSRLKNPWIKLPNRGVNVIDEMGLCCLLCNARKGSQDRKDFRDWVRKDVLFAPQRKATRVANFYKDLTKDLILNGMPGGEAPSKTKPQKERNIYRRDLINGGRVYARQWWHNEWEILFYTRMARCVNRATTTKAQILRTVRYMVDMYECREWGINGFKEVEAEFLPLFMRPVKDFYDWIASIGDNLMATDITDTPNEDDLDLPDEWDYVNGMPYMYGDYTRDDL